MMMQLLHPVKRQDPLATTRELLGRIWETAQLEFMLVPIYGENGAPIRTQVIEDPSPLQRADPFSPIMLENSALEAAELILNRAGRRGALVLRPCELRSLQELARRRDLQLSGTLIISADCLAAFPEEDLDWRIEAAKDPEDLTRHVLQFSAQGGILANRFRSGCQICTKPYPEDADLQFGVLGLNTREHLLIELRPEPRFHLDTLLTSHGAEVNEQVNQRRKRVLENLHKWRDQSAAYTSGHLAKERASTQALEAHLLECDDCLLRLAETCPLFEEGWMKLDGKKRTSAINSWIRSCAGCGLCEYHCPEGFPLFNVISHLHDTAFRVH